MMGEPLKKEYRWVVKAYSKKQVKSAVEWLKFKLDDVGIYEGQEWQRVADLIHEAFPNLEKVKGKRK